MSRQEIRIERLRRGCRHLVFTFFDEPGEVPGDRSEKTDSIREGRPAAA